MKRLLAAGYGDCWQMCKVFRDGESGRMHNPEFTLLEWYRVGFDDAALMAEVDALVRNCLDGHRVLGPTRRITYADAMQLASATDRAALDHDDEDLIFGALVAPRLGLEGPCFVTDWPVAQAALARSRPGNPELAGRFELFISGIELANGYHELCDPAEQRRRFAADNTARGRAAVPVDERLLAALEAGLPDCTGVALGVDRLVMLALGVSTITDVVAFPATDA
jgi:lysyl-tRNA synthetase class 2